MKNFKILKQFIIIILITYIDPLRSAPPPQTTLTQLKIDPNFVRVLNEFQRLEKKIPKDHFRTIATLGIITGAIEAEKNLEQHLTDKVADLILNLDLSDKNRTMPKIEKIEKIIERDRSAIKILGSAIDLATKTITSAEYRNEMKKTMRNFARKQRDIKKKMAVEEDMHDRLAKLKTEILDHMDTMKATIRDKANLTVSYLEGITHLSDVKVQRVAKEKDDDTPATTENIVKAILTDNLNENLVDFSKRQDFEDFSFDDYKLDFIKKNGKQKNKDNKIKDRIQISNNSKEKVKKSEKQELAKQEELDIDENDGKGTSSGSSEEAPRQQGGLPGLLAGLSGGGEEGSDIGALLGAVTGLVSQLFGPGGLDVPSLISTATSLIAGLLSGGRNFGIVLGEYVGLAFDGLSGGGGAELNGKFLGNLFGTTLAELSADPEDEDAEPKPALFITNFLNSFLRTKSKRGSEGSDEESDDDDKGDDNDKDHAGSSDSFGFIKHIVQAVVGGVTSFVLNASLGSSGGSSKGSHALIGSSSGGEGGHGHGHARSKNHRKN